MASDSRAVASGKFTFFSHLFKNGHNTSYELQGGRMVIGLIYGKTSFWKGQFCFLRGGVANGHEDWYLVEIQCWNEKEEEQLDTKSCLQSHPFLLDVIFRWWCLLHLKYMQRKKTGGKWSNVSTDSLRVVKSGWVTSFLLYTYLFPPQVFYNEYLLLS